LDLKIEHWPIEKLVPCVSNPRTHTPEQVAQFASSIAEFDFVNPILVGPDNVIIAGHARLAAAKQLGLSEVPVIVLRPLSEAQRRALVIAFQHAHRVLEMAARTLELEELEVRLHRLEEASEPSSRKDAA